MSIIIKEQDEVPLIVKLLKQAIADNNLNDEEMLVAHELYEDLKNG